MDMHQPPRLSFNLPEAFLEPRDPSVAFRFGRGRTGGTTKLDVDIQFARAAGRTVIVGDGDRRNPTLSGIYPPGTVGGALEPPISDETADVKDWLTASIGAAITKQQSLLVDMSGGDRAMQEYGRELGIEALCKASGLVPAAFYTCGPEMDDFDHILSIFRAGYYRPARSILVFNEHLVPQGRTARGAFDPIMERVELQDMIKDGVAVMFMPRLPCMSELRKSGLSFIDAASNVPGKDGKPMDPVRQFMVRQFLEKIMTEYGRIGALGWLP